jgi:hypothetical protein
MIAFQLVRNGRCHCLVLDRWGGADRDSELDLQNCGERKLDPVARLVSVNTSGALTTSRKQKE